VIKQKIIRSFEASVIFMTHLIGILIGFTDY